MGRLGVTCMGVAPLLADDVRRAIAASDDLRAVERMRRAGWQVQTDGRRTSGKRGPKLSK